MFEGRLPIVKLPHRNNLRIAIHQRPTGGGRLGNYEYNTCHLPIYSLFFNRNRSLKVWKSSWDELRPLQNSSWTELFQQQLRLVIQIVYQGSAGRTSIPHTHSAQPAYIKVQSTSTQPFPSSQKTPKAP
jgi:hypothetical protein